MNGNSPGLLPAFYRLAVGYGLWPLVGATPKSVSHAGIFNPLRGCNSDLAQYSNTPALHHSARPDSRTRTSTKPHVRARPDSDVPTAEGKRVGPSTCQITGRKRIALVAHDNQKEKLAGWASRQRARLVEHELYATAHTADVIAATLNVPVIRLLSGPLGGDQQIGSRIAESRIDVLVFFWDPLGLHPHDCDVKALLRLAAAYNIPNACNEATADCIISALAP
jgi:methylglyoxal synthase